MELAICIHHLSMLAIYFDNSQLFPPPFSSTSSFFFLLCLFFGLKEVQDQTYERGEEFVAETSQFP